MAIAHDAPAPAEPTRRDRLVDNPLVRAVGRVRLPLGAKLIAGFAVVAALLAVVAVLGLVALNKSNSRGLELPRLKQEASYERLLNSDAKNLKSQIDFRLQIGPDRATDQKIAADWNQLCLDAGGADCGRYSTGGCASCGPYQTGGYSRFPVRLDQLAYSLYQQLQTAAQTFYPNGGATPRTSTAHPIVLREDRFATRFARQLGARAREFSQHLNALIAANRRSYIHSRNLLIGVGAGSFALAVAFGLLLAASIVAPLRRTESRLDGIAAGDFADRLEVANRDEIGSLAAKVNRTSDELQRVHQELELASEHKSQFVTTMSHELRTPLNAIIGFSDVLHEQMFGELNERQLAYVDDIREAGRHQLSLINELLDLAKIEAGRMELELAQVAIPDVLRAAVSMHAERASRGGIELSLRTDPKEIVVIADELRVRQVVFNLLSNSVKFTPPQGRIDVSARLEGGNVEVAVADTGQGLSAEDLETIFEEFGQTTEGKQAEGTGLGLPLSRKLVELHGGRLWAESEPGHGSIFRFTLPLRAGP
jgi:signal transduction histidine kinase